MTATLGFDMGMPLGKGCFGGVPMDTYIKLGHRFGQVFGRGAMRIRIAWDNEHAEAVMADTPTAQRVWVALPCTLSASVWGEEIYFTVDFDCPEEPGAKDVMERGELAFWPGGNAIAIGFGRTPASRGDEIRLVSPCNVWANAIDDVRKCASVRDGEEVAVLMADS